MGFLIACLTLRGLTFKPLTLVQRIVQLGKGVRNFSAGDVQLESIGQGRICILPSRERRDFNRVVGDKGRLLKIRLNGFLKDLVEDRE